MPDAWKKHWPYMAIAAFAVIWSVYVFRADLPFMQDIFSPTQKIVVVDSVALLNAKADQIKDKSPAEVEQESRAMALGMKRLMEDYAAKGFVVINARAVMAYPKETDVTNYIAEQLGVPFGAHENKSQ